MSIKVFENKEVTMTSLELVDFINSNRKEGEAELRHSHFLEKVVKVLGAEMSRKFGSSYKDSMNRKRGCYRFPKREACLMAMSYSYELQAKVWDRMTELEEQVGKPQLPNFTDPAEAAIAWAVEYKAKQLALAKIEQDKPKVEFVEQLVEQPALLTATQVGQKLGLSARELNKQLDAIGGIYNKTVKRSRVFTQDWIDKGFGELKQTESGFCQALFTNKGEVEVFELLN